MFPDRDIYVTECNTMHGSDASHPHPYEPWGRGIDLVIDTTRRWARAVLVWSLAIDDAHQGPFTGSGCYDSGTGEVRCNAVIHVDTARGTVSYDADFYQLAHASRFVHPGAVRIDSTSYSYASVTDVAFRNTDGSTVLLAHNHAATPQAIHVQRSADGLAFDYTLPAGAIATFAW
jgi:glucosylceramidase